VSYIGNTPVNQNFVAGADQFSGTGSQTVFTLSRNVNTVFDMFVTVSNVPQDPFTAYTVAGNTLTFDGAPPAGTNNIDVVYRATNVQTFVPSPGVSQQFAIGTAASPAITFVGDTNTGIFSPAADTIAFTEGGAEVARFDSAGNFGLGLSPNTSQGRLQIVNFSIAGGAPATSGTTDVNQLTTFGMGSTQLRFGAYASGAAWVQQSANSSYATNYDLVLQPNGGNVGIGVTPVGTGLLELKAGTTSVAPLEFNAGTNTTSAVAGAVEYDGRVFYATPQGTQRGVVPGAQFFRLNAGLVGANVNTAQSVFGVGVTLSASTVYAFEAVYLFTKTAGATAHTIGAGFAGTATVNNIGYMGMGNVNSTAFAGSTGIAFSLSNSTANQQITNTFSGAATSFGQVTIRGTVSVNAGGTFIPQYTLSAAPGGAYTTAAGSYFMIYPIGAAGANTSVGTWA
jgi:hypothetical protein